MREPPRKGWLLWTLVKPTLPAGVPPVRQTNGCRTGWRCGENGGFAGGEGRKCGGVFGTPVGTASCSHYGKPPCARSLVQIYRYRSQREPLEAKLVFIRRCKLLKKHYQPLQASPLFHLDAPSRPNLLSAASSRVAASSAKVQSMVRVHLSDNRLSVGNGVAQIWTKSVNQYGLKIKYQVVPQHLFEFATDVAEDHLIQV